MQNETLIYMSNSFDPWYNLAVEELLLDTVGRNQHILYLWQNRDTLVIGRNQNPWKECCAEQLEKDGGYLARRLSGGGTVYHDLGNLNFTFLMNRENYNLEKQVGVILNAIKALGIPAEMTGRNDLTIDERKFSGNAFCFKKGSAYHHGTILISSNFQKLAQYLRVPKAKIQSKGIDSVRSRVVNLIEYCPSITIEEVKNLLCKEFAHVYNGNPNTIRNCETLNQGNIAELRSKYASWEWRYGATMKFDMEISTRFIWGGIELGMNLENGAISEVIVHSDAMDEEFIRLIPAELRGCYLNFLALSKNIRAMDVGSERKFMQEDIADWLENCKF